MKALAALSAIVPSAASVAERPVAQRQQQLARPFRQMRRQILVRHPSSSAAAAPRKANAVNGLFTISPLTPVPDGAILSKGHEHGHHSRRSSSEASRFSTEIDRRALDAQARVEARQPRRTAPVVQAPARRPTPRRASDQRARFRPDHDDLPRFGQPGEPGAVPVADQHRLFALAGRGDVAALQLRRLSSPAATTPAALQLIGDAGRDPARLIG